MNRKTRFWLIHAAIAVALGMATGSASAADGISYLVAVTQMKAANANDEALQGADKQRELVKKQQQLRGSQKNLESKDRLGNFEIQDLMSQHNQPHKQQSGAQKKHRQTSSGIVQNVK